MPTKARKQIQGPSLYKTFVDAYMKARPNEKRDVKHHNAQVEWNEIKWNEEYVKEKIEEYLEIYNELRASSNQGLERLPLLNYSNQSKTNRNRPVKRIKTNQTNKRTNQNNNENKKDDEQPNNFDDFHDDHDDDQDDDGDDNNDQEKNKNKKDYRIKKCKPFDEELIEDLRELPPVGKVPLEPLSKTKRQPAQERAYNELNAISDRIASLVQVKQMGLFTAENRKQLKQLMKDRQTKTFEIKRLQSKQRASTRYKDSRKKIVDHLFETKPELHPQLKKLYQIAKAGGASDDRRRSTTVRPCLTLDDLREKIKQRGYDIKRTTLYYRLLPHRASSRDGRRHVYTVPVRLRRAQNDDHGRHEDGHFATATIRYVKDLASIFGNDCVFYLSQDDKCKVPFGLPAAKIQASMVMHLDYRIRLPDHDWIVAPRHQLIPSVYAACLLSEDGDLLSGS
ncbi:unnamed protein product, partial [Rotaria sp. Silwood2]